MPSGNRIGWGCYSAGWSVAYPAGTVGSDMTCTLNYRAFGARDLERHRSLAAASICYQIAAIGGGIQGEEIGPFGAGSNSLRDAFEAAYQSDVFETVAVVECCPWEAAGIAGRAVAFRDLVASAMAADSSPLTSREIYGLAFVAEAAAAEAFGRSSVAGAACAYCCAALAGRPCHPSWAAPSASRPCG